MPTRWLPRRCNAWGALHVLHNNAYWALPGHTLLDVGEDEWDRTRAITLKSM